MSAEGTRSTKGSISEVVWCKEASRGSATSPRSLLHKSVPFRLGTRGKAGCVVPAMQGHSVLRAGGLLWRRAPTAAAGRLELRQAATRATALHAAPRAPLGVPVTRRRLRDRYCTSPYEPESADERPQYPKRKSPFKRAQALIDALHDEEAARLVRTGRAVMPTKIPYMRSGDIVRVAYVSDITRTNAQYFKGLCVSVKNRGLGSSFVLRNVVDGVAIERAWPLYSPLIRDAEVVDKKRVRRNKLWYLRRKPLRESSFGNATRRPVDES
jgi:large subunit ribosomal protein L19